MYLWRSISIHELIALSRDKTVHGRYWCSMEELNTCDMDFAVCFFLEKLAWIDSEHKITLLLDIPEQRLVFGEGIYRAAKSLENTKIWTGRRGSVEYRFKEAYTSHYSIKNIKKICTHGKIEKYEYDRYIIPFLEETGIPDVPFEILYM